MQKWITRSAFVVIAGAALATQASAQCDVTSLNGPYGYHSFGFNLENNGGGLFTAAGRFVANGAGKITALGETGSVDSGVFRGQTNTGSYVVNPDCTGTLTLRSATNRDVNYDFVLVNGNTELLFTGADQASGIWGQARAQSPLACDVTSVAGSWGFQLYGFTLTFPGRIAVPFNLSVITESGRFVSNGGGRLVAITDTTSVNGGITRGEFATGSYNVNADCTGSLLLRSSTNRDVNFDFALTNGSNEMVITGSSQAAGFYGLAKKQ